MSDPILSPSTLHIWIIELSREQMRLRRMRRGTANERAIIAREYGEAAEELSRLRAEMTV